MLTCKDCKYNEGEQCNKNVVGTTKNSSSACYLIQFSRKTKSNSLT